MLQLSRDGTVTTKLIHKRTVTNLSQAKYYNLVAMQTGLRPGHNTTCYNSVEIKIVQVSHNEHVAS